MQAEVKKSGRKYRYGDRPTWRIVIDAVESMARPVTPREVEDYVLSTIPHFARKNISPDLSVASVNSNSRGNHDVNRQPRRTDTGSRYDRLFRIGSGPGVRYVAYDPADHGVWELYDAGEKVLRTRQVTTADDLELARARKAMDSSGEFNPTDLTDERRRVIAAMVLREGQPAFRESLLKAYDSRCAITGCLVVNLLDAAHIARYSGPKSNVAANGLLLRTDLHKLFDLHLICIDPRSLTVHVSDAIKDTEYGPLDGQSLRLPREQMDAPSPAALEEHPLACAWALSDDADA